MKSLEHPAQRPPSHDAPSSKNPTRRQMLKVLGLGAVMGLGADNVLSRHEVARQRQQALHQTPEHYARPRPLGPGQPQPERLRISSEQPTFNRLREGSVFPREHRWAITASAEAFHRLGRTFAEQSRTAELLRRNEVRILVPAAGVLLSPLETGFQLAEASTSLRDIHFTYTDIDPAAYEVIDAYVERLVQACENTSDFEVSVQRHPELAQDANHQPAVKTMTFTYRTSGGRVVRMTMAYELSMSGSRYLRPDSAAEADIFVLHDLNRTESIGNFPATKEAGDIYTLLADTASPRLRKKPHFMVIDQQSGVYGHAQESVGTLVTALPGVRFGCGENHRDTNTPEALRLDQPQPPDHVVEIVELNSEMIQYLNEHGGQDTLRAYTQLAVPFEISYALSSDTEGRMRSSLAAFTRRLERMGNERFRHTVQSVARNTLSVLSHEEGGEAGPSSRAAFRARRELLRPIITTAQP